jgi:hypothetical protein
MRMRSFKVCTHPKILLGRPSKGECGGWGMWHILERRKKCARSWWGSLKERDHSED